jgi:chromosome segregation ATPase
MLLLSSHSFASLVRIHGYQLRRTRRAHHCHSQGLPRFASPLPSSPCPSYTQASLVEKNTELELARASVADRETKLAETWAQCEAKLAEKRAKYEGQVAAQQAAFDAAMHRMSEEFNSVVAQQEETVIALTKGLADERAALEQTRLALSTAAANLAEEKAKVAAVTDEVGGLRIVLKAAAADREEAKKREAEQVLAHSRLSGELEEANAKLAAAATVVEEMKKQEATYSAARHAASVENERLQREKEETEAKLRRAEMARAALQLVHDEACALAVQRATEIDQLTRERDNLVAKNTTLHANAAEDAQRLTQLHERIAALEARSPETTKKVAPRHPVAVPNSAAKGRSRRSLSAGPRCIHGDAHGVCRPCDLTADSDDDDENSQPATTLVNTRTHRSGKRTGTPKK